MRKVVDGEIRNRKRTEEKLINAVGDLIKEEGYSGLNMRKVVKLAGVDKKLIYRYFGNFDGLISRYFRERDFWTRHNERVFENINTIFNDHGKNIASSSLINLFEYLQHQEDTRKILLWEISESNDNFKKLSLERELLGKELFQRTDYFFENSEVDLRACYSILLAGVYYLSLHSNSTGGNFCEIDISKSDGSKRIKKAIQNIIDLLYNEV
ncbi:TetR/AcrR family transcriptional regulator [Sphingobacterium anhuiense]|uniref:TetR/AcrR family transcriptional regulator n=1 Tax=Sphingobacterium anhuiense TaxID=493780 RepID=A0ABW5YZ73_9SPHI